MIPVFLATRVNGNWQCQICGGDAVGTQVFHEKKGFDDGGPRTVYTKEFFCPKCNKPPDPIGDPVYID